ncbi:MAG: glycosyltransferase [Steroidobacteraceae bacterium]|nr:glycosyltransferase [Steroidobacteraceae bacterium]
MKLTIFGLTLSSSWGNGHATLWRGLVRALGRAGHEVVFFERDVPYYAQHRDLPSIPDGTLVLYAQWDDVLPVARRHLAASDAVIITSYCPDAIAATRLLDEARGLRVFYDLDAPVTLARLSRGERVDYIPEDGLSAFDLVLSYTGGAALDGLRDRLGARHVAPLYGHADPAVHCPAQVVPRYRADLSYLGTYASDRQRALEELFIEPARRCREQRFVIGGSGHPPEFPWVENVWFVRHVAPPEHAAFYSSSRLTLNVTRADMAAMGFCPSGRLFEAAACGTPVLSDTWEGLDSFFTPGEEILLARTREDAIAALELPPGELARIAMAARQRVLDEHSSAHRVRELLSLLDRAAA